MDTSGILWFAYWVSIFIILLCVPMKVWPWELMRAEFVHGSLVKPEEVLEEQIVQPARSVKHWCAERSCLHRASQDRYTFMNMTAETYWMDHWLQIHDTVAPPIAYIEVIHNADVG